jgi:uncharacterized repeat protein (TIGR03803 family)
MMCCEAVRVLAPRSPALPPQQAPAFDCSNHGETKMKSMRFSIPLLAALAITFGLAVRAQAQTLTTLANFIGSNGDAPYYGSLVQATNGNYYGTTHYGGKYSGGTVFQVTPAGELTVLYNFCSRGNCADGKNPFSSLLLGSDGNFYGTTNTGGAYGYGTIFKMTIGGKFTTLYSFCRAGGSCTDGAYPVGLVQASNGNFYGATSNAGANNGGTIFQISSAGAFKLLYSFCAQTHCTDGWNPLSAPMQASNGTFYGTVKSGGTHGRGAVYKITMAGQFKTLYSFCAQTSCTDGAYPQGGLIQDSNGSFYGTTVYGGATGYGTVFQITTTNPLITLHSFASSDGRYPVSGLTQANDGNFYGTTSSGGTGLGGGTIYEVTSVGVFISLYDFCGTSTCTGSYPGYTLAQATNGELIGATTYTGRIRGYGTVFSLSTGLGPLVETVPTAAKVGARVIILGNGLTGTTSVTFNGTSATFTVVSDTEITTTVPTGATTGTVSVTTPTGTLNSNPSFQVLK